MRGLTSTNVNRRKLAADFALASEFRKNRGKSTDSVFRLRTLDEFTDKPLRPEKSSINFTSFAGGPISPIELAQ
jgi:hypothetical protein